MLSLLPVFLPRDISEVKFSRPAATVSGAALMIGDLVTGRSAENIGVGVGVSIPSELMDNPGQVRTYVHTYVTLSWTVSHP